eukprot:gene25773-18754_t
MLVLPILSRGGVDVANGCVATLLQTRPARYARRVTLTSAIGV